MNRKKIVILLAATAIVVSGVVLRTLAQPPLVGSTAPITNTGQGNPLRNPSFARLGEDQLTLWWRHLESPDETKSSLGIPLEYAIFQNGSFKIDKNIVSGLHGYPDTLRVRGVPKQSFLATCLELGSYFRDSTDVGIRRIFWTKDAKGIHFNLEPRLDTVLPYSVEGFPAPPPQWKEGFSNRLQYPVTIHDGYSRPDLLISKTTNTWYLVGLGYDDKRQPGRNVANIWFSKSSDNGISWKPRVFIGQGNEPSLVENSRGEVSIIYTNTGSQSPSSDWPDDSIVSATDKSTIWPSAGQLVMRSSKDAGDTWGDEANIVSDKSIIEGRACRGDDGRIWLTYVQSDPSMGADRRTTLWLTSSSNDGGAWKTVGRVTDGRTLDREPDITEVGGKIMIAFTRSGKGINTNIWVSQIEEG